MRKIIATARISLDAVMQGPNGHDDTSGGFDLGGWTARYANEKSAAAVVDLVGTLAKPYDLLMGRKTYDTFAGYWPTVPNDNRIGPVFTKANKYVLTRSSTNLTWVNSHRLRSIDELRKVKSEEGRDIVLWGSSTLYPQLLDADLIDRLVLMTCPIVLGKGKRIFGNTSHPMGMTLTQSEVTSTGVIMATYERAPGDK